MLKPRSQVILTVLVCTATITLTRAGAQGPEGSLLDPLELPRLKSFKAGRVSSNNPDPNSNYDHKPLPPGETLTLADLAGPGVITHLWLTIAANEYGWPRLARLRLYWDGQPQPCVDVPLGDFFAVGHGYEREVLSLPVRNTSRGRARNCYWPMPFRQSARITVTNEGQRPLGLFYYHVDWQKHPALPDDLAYFHAHYRQAQPAPPGENYVIADLQGRGHYVGTVLSVVQNRTGWWGEGDDWWYVDGEEKASIEGTGSEDYFNDAWGFREVDGPYYGVTVAEGGGTGARSCAYRWHLVDPVPFQQSLRLEIEHKGWTFNDETDGSVRSGFEERADHFSSVAFWYQMEPHAPLPDLPVGAARLPYGHALQIEAEDRLEEASGEKGQVHLQEGVFWTRDILFFTGQEPEAKLTVPFEVPEEGRYEVSLQLVHSYDYGNYQASLDGQPLGRVLEAYAPSTYASFDHPLGRATLTAGRHELTFLAVGKDPESTGYYFGLDNIVLARVD